MDCRNGELELTRGAYLDLDGAPLVEVVFEEKCVGEPLQCGDFSLNCRDPNLLVNKANKEASISTTYS